MTANLITDVEGVRVGSADDGRLASGVTVVLFDEPAVAFDSDIALGSRAIMVISGAVALLFIVAASPIITAADAAAKALLP